MSVSCFNPARGLWVLLFVMLVSCDFTEPHGRGVEPSAASTYTSKTQLKRRRCNYYAPADIVTRCFNLTTSSVPSFTLPIVLISSKSTLDNDEDSSLTTTEVGGENLVIRIPGGPGQGFQTTEDNMDYWVAWYQDQQPDFDLLLYDPRGTGGAMQEYSCQAYDQLAIDIAAKNVGLEDELSQSLAALTKCLSTFNPDMFSSFRQAQDVIDIATSMAYTRRHLWGISYGTRVALLAADSPYISSLALDSAYPFSRGKISDWPGLLQGAFVIHEKTINTVLGGANQNMPHKHWDFLTLFTQAQKILAQNPLHYTVEQVSSTSSKVSLVLNSHRLVALAYFVLYDQSLFEPFYRGLIALNDLGNTTNSDDLALVVEAFVDSAFDREFNNFVYFATECADNERVSEDVFIAELDRLAPRFHFLVDYLAPQWQYDVCRDKVFDSIARVHEASYTQKPSLIFGGEKDPVTPVEWGREITEKNARARLISVKDIGHGVVAHGVCEVEMLNRFIVTQDENLSVSCNGVVH